MKKVLFNMKKVVPTCILTIFEIYLGSADYYQDVIKSRSLAIFA
jgi:hypothetical protein